MLAEKRRHKASPSRAAKMPEVISSGGDQQEPSRSQERRLTRANAISERTKAIESHKGSIFSTRIRKIMPIVTTLLNLIVATMAIRATSALESGPTNNLPTVIVRGFLNYRTTVDGTVLLFTPDAGGSQAASSVSASSTQAPSSIKSSASSSPDSADWQIQPTATSTAPVVASTMRLADVASLPASDEWRPITATPPLRSNFQTAFRPEVVSATPSLAELSSSSSAMMQQDEPNREASSTSSSQQLLPSNSDSSSPTPSVQTDDVTTAMTTGETSSPRMPVEVSTASGRPLRPKRPSLGFSGQAIRAGGRSQAAAPGGATSELSSSPEASRSQTSKNSINGIRRPGLSTTTATPQELAATSSPQSVSMSNPFQGRLTSSSAKLRNRLKRPQLPKAGSASESPVGTSSVAPPTVSADPNEPEVSSQAQPVQRMGDLFGANSVVAPMPVVGSDEIMAGGAGGGSLGGGRPGGAGSGDDPSGDKPAPRLGEQRPSASGEPLAMEPQLLSGSLLGNTAPELQQGQLGSMPPGMDSFFQPASEQPQPPAEASEQHAHHHQPISVPSSGNSKRHNNDKLNGWLDQHHNKFVPRQSKDSHPHPGQNQQLAHTLNSLTPSFAAHLPSSSSMMNVRPTPTQMMLAPNVTQTMTDTEATSGQQNTTEVQPMQTLTKTYSTVMTTSKTRLVPLQVKSSTAIHTITEHYVITKMLTAYQTMPAQGEFILTEMSTRSPFEIFNDGEEKTNSKMQNEQPISAPSNFAPSAPQQQEQQEQPISLPTEPKSPNDWLHDFSNADQGLGGPQQPSPLAALLEQQQQDPTNSILLNNLLNSPDQLDTSGLAASSLDPAALLAEGTIPDLNNPLVLAAAIQNPQLAAVILAAQQLQLKQRQNKAQQPHQANQPLLQPSYSTSLSTQVRPSTYTVRDTMYTTRLVSFKDGRTVRTRTVSEPGQVIEQVLTTTATEITPVTITIRPTGVLAAHSTPQTVSPQATLNNALVAAQLAQLLNRRQQQVVQPSFMNPAMGANQQLGAQLQQLLAAQRSQQQPSGGVAAQAKQFQPNLQQLLQSMQSPSSPNLQQQQNQKPQNQQQPDAKEPAQSQSQKQAATPPLPASLPTPALGPIVTTLTNLQVRTYTVHNAFKTIYRTITSTQLITSTLLPGRG